MQIVESINFHHDAITGTHYDNVGIGYDKSMLDALKRNSLIESKLIKNLAEISGLKIDQEFEQCFEQFNLYTFTNYGMARTEDTR